MERLELVDFLLFFRGQIQRRDLMSLSGGSIATATRTLTEYRRQYPENLEYAIGQKRYLACNTFKPAFEHDAQMALQLLAYGEIKRSVNMPDWQFEAPVVFNHKLDTYVVATIANALTNNRAAEISYFSTTSGHEGKRLIPTAIFCSESYWYFRAYDLKKSEYRNYRFSRCGEGIVGEANDLQLPEDEDWQTEVTLTIAPHCQHPYPAALKMDLGLVDKPVVNIQTRAALAGLALVEMRVDCSLKACLEPRQFQMQLMNRHELTKVSSMVIAPGWAL